MSVSTPHGSPGTPSPAHVPVKPVGAMGGQEDDLLRLCGSVVGFGIRLGGHAGGGGRLLSGYRDDVWRCDRAFAGLGGIALDVQLGQPVEPGGQVRGTRAILRVRNE
jgi:hypothetical protein